MVHLSSKPFLSRLRYHLLWTALYGLIHGLLGVCCFHQSRLPRQGEGPFIVVANHNSHLDTLILLSLFGPTCRQRIRPVAAADYFNQHPILKCLADWLLNPIYIDRQPQRHKSRYGQGSSEPGAISARSGPLAELEHALEQGESILLFPEGSRGEPEVKQPFQRGIVRIIQKFPQISIVPVLLSNAGRSLPKGDPVLIPMFIHCWVGQPQLGQRFVEHLDDVPVSQRKQEILTRLELHMDHLETQWRQAIWFNTEEAA